MDINYSTIVTKEEMSSLTYEKYNEIKTLCSHKIETIQDRQIYDYKFKSKSFDIELSSREFAFRNPTFQHENLTVKTLLAANILYTDNEMLINILLSRNITYDKLSRIVSKINVIKQISQLKDSIELLDDNTTISDKNLNILCNLIRRYYNYEDKNLIIAKLVEIVVFEKELYLCLENSKVKTR